MQEDQERFHAPVFVSQVAVAVCIPQALQSLLVEGLVAGLQVHALQAQEELQVDIPVPLVPHDFVVPGAQVPPPRQELHALVSQV